MIILQFWNHKTIDQASHFEILQYAVNDQGLIAQKEWKGALTFDIPEPDAFLGGETLLGLAQYANIPKNNVGGQLYTFAQITPALVATLDFGPISNSHFTIITNRLGMRFRWSRGLENILFV
jgi:hypothetical protein